MEEVKASVTNKPGSISSDALEKLLKLKSDVNAKVEEYQAKQNKIQSKLNF